MTALTASSEFGLRLSGKSASYRATPVPLFGNFTAQVASVKAGLSSLRSKHIDIAAENLIRHQFEPFYVQPAQRDIKALAILNDDWDGCGSIAPTSKAIGEALALLPQMYAAATLSGSEWFNPHVSAGEAGEVMFEWWNGPKKLTMYISGESSECIRVWGPDIHTQMDSSVVSSRKISELWGWLFEK